MCIRDSRLDLGPNCYAQEGVGISNTPEKCGKELNEYLLTEKADVLISCGGGELMCETLDYVDFKGISEASPKWYICLLYTSRAALAHPP